MKDHNVTGSVISTNGDALLKQAGEHALSIILGVSRMNMNR